MEHEVIHPDRGHALGLQGAVLVDLGEQDRTVVVDLRQLPLVSARGTAGLDGLMAQLDKAPLRKPGLHDCALA